MGPRMGFEWRKANPPEPQAEEAPAEDSTLARTLTALEVVAAWRFVGLLKLDFSYDQAILLIDRPDVVHDAEALLARGCSTDFAFEELRP